MLPPRYNKKTKQDSAIRIQDSAKNLILRANEVNVLILNANLTPAQRVESRKINPYTL